MSNVPSSQQPLFACTQCGIAYFYTAKHLQQHYMYCNSLREVKKTIESLDEKIHDQRSVLGNLIYAVKELQECLSSFRDESIDRHKQLVQSTMPKKTSRDRKKRSDVETDEQEGPEDETKSLLLNSVADSSTRADVQLSAAVGYFRKRKLELPISEERISELECLLNDSLPDPEITFSEFKDLVQEDVPFIRSLFSEFLELLQSVRERNGKEKKKYGVDEEEEEEEEGDLLEKAGIRAADVTASLEAAGGANSLLLSKFLQIFHDGFEKHRFRFPLVVFNVGKRKILKFTERLFTASVQSKMSSSSLPSDNKKRKVDQWMESVHCRIDGKQQQEQEEDFEEDEIVENDCTNEDLDNISCFPFFVFVDKEVGWKIMKYTDHVYPLFAIIQTTILVRGLTDSDVMMSQEENKISQVVSSMQSSNKKRVNDQSYMITRKLEANYAERTQMISKLSETVVQFMMNFRKKYFEHFLQDLYENYSVSAENLVRFLSVSQSRDFISNDNTSTSVNSSRFTSAGSRKSVRSSDRSVNLNRVPSILTRQVYVYNEDEELFPDEDM